MVQVYYNLIISGKKTIKDVPQKLRADVILLLEENGYSELAKEDQSLYSKEERTNECGLCYSYRER